MKKFLMRGGGRCALMLGAASAHAPTSVTLQLKWVTQAQFAGYYVAKDKGFYKEAGLDVTIKPGGPDIAPQQVHRRRRRRRRRRLDAGGARRAREGRAAGQHRPAVQALGHELTCRADTGIKTPADLKGRTLGVWFFGNEYPFLSWMASSAFRRPTAPTASRW